MSKSLKDVGLFFSDEGILFEGKDKKFNYNTYDDAQKNRERYNRLGDYINEYIYDYLVNELKLVKTYIPKDDSSSKRSFVFHTPNFSSSDNYKMVLINGSGVVRAGQWSRRIIMNDNLFEGSMIAYIRWGQENSMDILVLNTNECHKDYPMSTDPIKHAITAFKTFIAPIKAEKKVFIVAHSFGGVAVQELFETFKADLELKVKGIALTDSVHFGLMTSQNSDVFVTNWVSSNKPKDHPLKKGNNVELFLQEPPTTP